MEEEARRRRPGLRATQGRKAPVPDLDRHLLALRQSVAALRRHGDVPRWRLLFNTSRRRSVERGLQLCSRSVLDISRRIGPAAYRNPAAYASSIECLLAARVLPPDLGERLGAFAAVGDTVAQGTKRLGASEMLRVLSEHLDDLDALADHVERWIAGRRDQ